MMSSLVVHGCLKQPKLALNLVTLTELQQPVWASCFLPVDCSWRFFPSKIVKKITWNNKHTAVSVEQVLKKSGPSPFLSTSLRMKRFVPSVLTSKPVLSSCEQFVDSRAKLRTLTSGKFASPLPLKSWNYAVLEPICVINAKWRLFCTCGCHHSTWLGRKRRCEVVTLSFTSV